MIARHALVAALLGALPGAVQTLQEDTLRGEREDSRLPPQSEGVLQNDVFLPVSSEAGVLLVRGDGGLERSRTLQARRAAAADVERARTAALDDWFTALETGATDGSVAPDPTGAGLVTEGLSFAVLRRLEALDEVEREAWRARFEPTAAASLGGAVSADPAGLERLGEVERAYPGTVAAARAALLCVDRVLESGHEVRAAAWLERARRHARLVGDPRLLAAIETRAALLGPPPTPATPAWEHATRLVPLGSLELTDPEAPPSGKDGVLPQRGIRPGLAWLTDERFLVQTSGRVHEVVVGERGPSLRRSFAPADLVALELGPWEPPYAGREAPGWGHAPAVVDGRLVLVGGRAFVPPGVDEEVEPNVLMAIDLDGDTPLLAWAIAGEVRVRGAGPRERDPELALAGGLELQPAPVVVDGLVLVPAREIGAEERAWLCAFELATGELAWRRFLAQGEDVARGGGRFGGGPGPRLADPAALRVAERLFAATHLGAATLVDLVDGRPVWSVGTRRRGASDAGWSAAGPFAFDAQVLWDPADSDVLYRFLSTPLAGDRPERASVFAALPRRRGTAELLLGGDANETLVCGRTGAAQAVTLWRGQDADPLDALHLGPREHFRGKGLVGQARTLACTERGVYLFDRERELYLLDYAPLEPGGDGAGGDLFAHGELVCVLGPRRLWAFRALP